MVFAIFGAILAVGTMILLCTRDRACLPSGHRRRRRAFPPEDDIELQNLPPHGRESFEQIGELHIPPGRQPTRMALDMITRFLMALGCPSKATSAAESASTGHGRTDSAQGNSPENNADLASSQPRDELTEIDLSSSRPSTLPDETSLPAMTNAQASVAAKGIEGNFLQSMRKARAFLSQLPMMRMKSRRLHRVWRWRLIQCRALMAAASPWRRYTLEPSKLLGKMQTHSKSWVGSGKPPG